MKLLGTVEVSVSVSGKPTLVFEGKTVKSLKAGRYAIKVADHATKAGLLLGEGSKSPLVLSSAAKVGPSSQSVSPGAGRCRCEATAHGPKTHVTVVG